MSDDAEDINALAMAKRQRNHGTLADKDTEIERLRGRVTSLHADAIAREQAQKDFTDTFYRPLVEKAERLIASLSQAERQRDEAKTRTLAAQLVLKGYGQIVDAISDALGCEFVPGDDPDGDIDIDAIPTALEKIAELKRERDQARDRYNREVHGLNNEGDPIGGDPPCGLRDRAERYLSRATHAETAPVALQQEVNEALQLGEGPSTLKGLAAMAFERGLAALNAETSLSQALAREAALREALTNARGLLSKTYTVLAFAFNRIHALPRSRDTELACDIGKVRGEIEAWQKSEALATPSPAAEAMMKVVETAKLRLRAGCNEHCEHIADIERICTCGHYALGDALVALCGRDALSPQAKES